MIKDLKFVSDYIVFDENVSYSDSEQDFFDSEFSYTKEGKGLQISTPDQMLSRLPITLAQWKARSNSENLKNEIRQLMYSLYISKNLQNNFINV